MAKKGFNWGRLPVELHADVIVMVDKEQRKELLKVHNQYKLSTYDYGCCELTSLLNRFRDAIDNGDIK